MTQDRDSKKAPPAVQSADPEPELEEKLRDNPEDRDAKVDVASDQSMDASDPPSVVQSDHDEPVPSSGFDENEGD